MAQQSSGARAARSRPWLRQARGTPRHPPRWRVRRGLWGSRNWPRRGWGRWTG